MFSMKQLTVRGFDDDLAEAIRQLARRDLPQPGGAEAPQKGRGPAGRSGFKGGRKTDHWSVEDQHKCPSN